MGLTELAKYYEYSPTYFFIMRKNTPKKFYSILKEGANPIECVNKYILHVEQLALKMEEILNSYETKKDFGEWMKEHNLSKISNPKNYTQTHVTESTSVFKLRESKDFLSVRYSVVKKWEQIVELKQSESSDNTFLEGVA